MADGAEILAQQLAHKNSIMAKVNNWMSIWIDSIEQEGKEYEFYFLRTRVFGRKEPDEIDAEGNVKWIANFDGDPDVDWGLIKTDRFKDFIRQCFEYLIAMGYATDSDEYICRVMEYIIGWYFKSKVSGVSNPALYNFKLAGEDQYGSGNDAGENLIEFMKAHRPIIIGLGKPKHSMLKTKYNYAKNRALEKAKLNRFFK
jgi:hypothetical protein